MRRFLKRLLIAMVLFSALIVGACLLLHFMRQKPVTYDNKCVFVWGDSQMYQGLDVSLLSKELEKQVLTSANHGSGIYDFLVSQKNIPDNAVGVMSFSEAALYRNPLSDNNRTGFEIDCLKEVLLSGCSVNECIRIFNLNKKSFRYMAFSNSPHMMYPFADSLVYPETLPLWHSLFEEPKDWFSWKAKAYTNGIQHLFDKHSQIMLIQFPFDEQVESFAKNSINRQLSDSLKFEIIDRFAMKYDTIVLHSDSLLMHDLSHMNEVGARMVTLKIANIIQKDSIQNHFVDVKIR
ncbi:MAG: hypothetical protein K6G25_08955 [Bacteroidales bacterium]|nr:hypothetical protein [Bacteroidales bacterium]